MSQKADNLYIKKKETRVMNTKNEMFYINLILKVNSNSFDNCLLILVK